MSFFNSFFSRTLLRPMAKIVAAQQQSPSYYFLLTQTHSVKTCSGVKKRFRLRPSGSLKRIRAGKSHNTGYKTRKRVNNLGSTTGVKGRKIEDRIRKMLGCY